jgi:hypothetical protein
MMEQQIVLGVMDIHEVEEWTEEYWRELGMDWSNLHPMILRFLHGESQFCSHRILQLLGYPTQFMQVYLLLTPS